MDNNKGFSLIEILISIVLLGFLLLAVLEAEAISIHNNYSNVYMLYSREILSYELSYAHIWANEGNVNWTSTSPQKISCAGFGDTVPSTYPNGNCLSVQNIGTALDIGTSGSYNIPLPKNIGIFLYITPSSTSTTATIHAIVIWAFSQQGVQNNLKLQDSETFGSSSTNSPYYMITSVSTNNVNYLNGINTIQFNNAISAEDIITRLN
jgi:prepilin-type N-terminal cleavage/methylation domain-containing protein